MRDEIVNSDCSQKDEIELISFRCHLCKSHCELGDAIMRAWNRVENAEYHRKIEEE